VVITEQLGQACSDAHLNVVYISNVLYDILVERTGLRLFEAPQRRIGPRP
jgi:hypothetical protein